MASYTLTSGCIYSKLPNFFGRPVSAANKFFNKIYPVHVGKLYDCFVYLPSTYAKWKADIHEFLKNYKFSCVGSWDGFHIYIASNLTKVFSMKRDIP